VGAPPAFLAAACTRIPATKAIRVTKPSIGIAMKDVTTSAGGKNSVAIAQIGEPSANSITIVKPHNMGYTAPWYSNAHLDDPTVGVAGRISCYLRREDKIYLTYWTTGRGDEVMSPLFGLLDMTAYGRREEWEDSPEGWPQFPTHSFLRTDSTVRRWGPETAVDRCPSGRARASPGWAYKPGSTATVASAITMTDTTTPLPPVVDRDTWTAGHVHDLGVGKCDCPTTATARGRSRS
jgi:hypothetical protein